MGDDGRPIIEGALMISASRFVLGVGVTSLDEFGVTLTNGDVSRRQRWSGRQEFVPRL